MGLSLRVYERFVGIISGLDEQEALQVESGRQLELIEAGLNRGRECKRVDPKIVMTADRSDKGLVHLASVWVRKVCRT